MGKDVVNFGLDFFYQDLARRLLLQFTSKVGRKGSKVVVGGCQWSYINQRGFFGRLG